MSVRELQKQFMLTATAAILIVMAVILGALNLYNYSRTFLTGFRVADYIAQSGGVMPSIVDEDQADLSPEAPYSVRYFTVWADETGQITAVHTDRIRSITREEAREAASAVHIGSPGGLSGHEPVLPAGLSFHGLFCRHSLVHFQMGPAARGQEHGYPEAVHYQCFS